MGVVIEIRVKYPGVGLETRRLISKTVLGKGHAR
jgi:hypothetical protein